METKSTVTHVMRQKNSPKEPLVCGIYTPGVGFIMVSPKHGDERAESGIYRIIREVLDYEILTLDEAQRCGWITRSPLISRHRRQFEDLSTL